MILPRTHVLHLHHLALSGGEIHNLQLVTGDQSK
jgi:hypothetical protein